MKYVAATLIGKHKTYAIPLFYEYLDKLNQKPEKLFISTVPEVFELCPWGTHIQGPNDLGNDRIPSTTSAREEIRQRGIEYMEKNKIEWMLWLDNDIGVPVDLIERAETFLKKQPLAVMINSYHPCRTDSQKLRHGMACTFTHIDALKSGPFTRIEMRGKNLGDDQIWLRTIQHLAGSKWNDDIMTTHGGVYFDVVHFVEDGSMNVLLEKDRGQLI